MTGAGNDTGSVAFQADRDLPQVYLPLYTDGSGALSVHAYLVQGGFGSSATSIGSLGSTAWTSPDISEQGVPYAYSLDARVRVSVLVNDGVNHVKRVEVIRPRGNAVVFDFKWDSVANQFSPVGTPAGYNDRDARRLYVLRDLTPQDDSDFSYAMLFPSGVSHVFGGDEGFIQSVKDSSGLSVNVTPGLFNQPPHSSSSQATIDTGLYPATPLSSDRYDVTLNWSAGHLDGVTYAAKGGGGEAFTTSLVYNAQNSGDLPAIVAVNKSAAGPVAAGSIPDYSYQLLDPTTIDHNGAETARTGTVASGTVTLTSTLPGVAGSSQEQVSFNSDALVTADARTLTEPDGTSTTATTNYAYAPDAGRAPANGAATWGEVARVTYPDLSWESYTYAPDTGWTLTDATPFKDGGQTIQTLSYAPATGPNGTGGGDVADPTRLVERPRQVTTAVNGTTTGIVFNQYHDADHSFVTRHALALASVPPRPPPGPTPACSPPPRSPATAPTPSHSAHRRRHRPRHADHHQHLHRLLRPPHLRRLRTLNAFGQVTASLSTGLGAAQTRHRRTPPADALGRPRDHHRRRRRRRALRLHLEGPRTVAAPDGTVTSYTYTPWGQVQTETRRPLRRDRHHDLRLRRRRQRRLHHPPPAAA